jgi:hypothetical protein
VETVTTTISLDVRLSDKDCEAVKKLLEQKEIRVIKEAKLLVQVEVRVDKKT